MSSYFFVAAEPVSPDFPADFFDGKEPSSKLLYASQAMTWFRSNGSKKE